MKSSFVRKGTQQLQEPGTRPGLHGQTLVSTGLSGLDSLLGGGQPLGAVLLVLKESHRSPQCASLVKYFLGEGVACGQALCFASGEGLPGGAAAFIPAQPRTGSSATVSAASEDEEPELRIAWQYRRYIKSKAAADAKRESEQSSRSRQTRRSLSSSHGSSASGTATEWCHKFDLGRPLGSKVLEMSGTTVTEVQCNGATAMSDLKGAISSFVQRVQKAGSSGGTRAPLSVGRIVVDGLGSPMWQLDGQPTPAEDAITHMLYWIRGVVRDTRCAAVVTLSLAGFPLQFQQQVPYL
eukprot:CAMPEP_0117684042 /NCGR_PEP_ID=MMETSP0804-20121206/20830_1 /TAXON_ID=1074897 /ORGANISM="Tetraselmis astigmatica, Strain CCMP880" /LENGTH=294 /DNA_ID=CAMNT_0005494891 /DNA_START=74 /DNA_END=954 /DNA_ORIENTATION=+